MKKNFMLLISFILLPSYILFADTAVPVTALPAKATSFINTVYPDVQIMLVERDGRKFDVKLSNGVSIDFLPNGDWENIDSEYVPIPDTAFPANVVKSIRSAYPQASIIDAEKEWGNYKIKLNNMMEVVVSANGKIMGQKFDD